MTALTPRTSRSSATILLLIVPLSVWPFAVVHDPWIVSFSVLLLLSPLLLLDHPRSPPSRITFFCAALTYGALALSIVQVAPYTDALRPLLQPGLSGHIEATLSLLALPERPLALNLPAALRTIAWSGATLGLALTFSAIGRPLQRSLAVGVIAAGLLEILLAAAQRLTGATSIFWISGTPEAIRSPFFGAFINPNHAGAFLAAGAAAALGLGGRRALAAAAALSVGVFFTGSRGALLALLTAGAVFLLRTTGRRGAVWLGAGLLPVILASAWVGPQRAAYWLSLQITPEDHLQDLTGHRLQIWADGLRLLADAPLLGVGPGGFGDGFRTVKSLPQHATVDHAHNDFLQTLIEQGLIGGGMWLLAAAAVTWAAARRPDRMGAGWLAALAALGCAALVDFPLQIGALSLLTATIAGAVLSESGPRTAPSARGFLLFGAAITTATLSARLWLSTPEARIEAGDAAYAQRESDPEALATAEADYRGALWLAPLSHQALLRLGRQAWIEGEQDQAEAIFAQAAAGYPTLIWPWVNLARLRATRGDHDGAHDAWRAALSSNVPDNDDATPWIIEALAAGPDPITAALAIAPERADRQRDIAHVLLDQPDTPGARAAVRDLYAAAIASDPRSRLGYAAALLRWGEAAAALEQLDALPRDDCRTARLSGKAHEQLGDVPAAQSRYRQARRSCPASLHDNIDGALSRLAELSGDPTALAAAEAALAAQPTRHALRRRLIAGLCASTPLPRTALLGHLEHLILEAEPTLEESQMYSRLLSGGSCSSN